MSLIKALLFFLIVCTGVAAISFSVARTRWVQILLVFLINFLLLFSFDWEKWMASREVNISSAVLIGLIALAFFSFCSMIMLKVLRERTRPERKEPAYSQKSALITISRERDDREILRKYRVICDGIEIGRISYGSSAEFTISPGSHCLILKIDWCSSNEIHFDIDADRGLRFTCGSNLRGWRWLLVFYYALFARKRYLWLLQQGSSYRLALDKTNPDVPMDSATSLRTE
ncbi:MAG: hypothetical protein FWC38_02720 [Proteobacteria bacterium]|nr:hypothetical protein [Pseudomonadota bacterium]MCL2307149.1 hypothetical protein [Pseudomonadota bacterium]